MKFGKTIKIFLIDGDPNGRMSCEISNWSGKSYKIPRIKIKDCDYISVALLLPRRYGNGAKCEWTYGMEKRTRKNSERV